VCGRFILSESKEKLNAPPRDYLFLESSPSKDSQTNDSSEDKIWRPLIRRSVKVVDTSLLVPDLIPFGSRLHPWTTIRELKYRI
jgi:hypothetical protein